MAQPTEITLSLDLDSYLAVHRGYDEDGESIQSPTTVEDIVLRIAADSIVRHVMRDGYDWRGDLRNRVGSIRDDLIAEKLRPDIDAAFAGPVQKTNTYGDPVGEPVTMREVIVGRVEEWLKSSDRDSYRNPKGLTKPQQLIAEEVDRVLAREMKEAIAAAKAEVVAAVQAKGAELLAQTIAAMAGGRS